MKAHDMTEPDLDALLASARKHDPLPSDALRVRVMADAAALQPSARRADNAATGSPVPVSRWLDRLAAVFGGGGALAGVSLAAVAGVLIGVVQPDQVAMLTSALLSETQMDAVDMLPAETAFWDEQDD